jgi:hypothetical protein
MDPAQASMIRLAIRAIDSALAVREALEAERRATDKLRHELAERQFRLLRDEGQWLRRMGRCPSRRPA